MQLYVPKHVIMMGSVYHLKYASVQEGGKDITAHKVELLISPLYITVLNLFVHMHHMHAATCTPSCQNGECVRPGQCECNPGWTGEHCEQGMSACHCMYSSLLYRENFNTIPAAICTRTCKNGGECAHPEQCVCRSNWTGPTCEQRTYEL